MYIYTQTLSDLLNQQTKELKESQYFFSFYFPTHHKTKLEINQQLKTEVLEYFRNEIKFSDKKEMHYMILDLLTEYVDSLDEMPKGIALFAIIDMQNNYIEKENSKFISLSETPNQETFIGKSYMLDQLIDLINTDHKALIIQIQREECTVYKMEDGKFTHCYTEKNELLEYDVKERNKRPSPFSDRQKYFGGGEYTMQRREQDENLNFLNQILDKITSDRNIVKDLNFVIVFHSKEFNGTIEPVMEANRSRIGNVEFIFSDKTIKDKNDLEKISNKLIHKYYKNKKKELLAKAQEEHTHFVEGWDEVAKNSQMRKIEILFLKPSAIKDGYIYDNNFIYTNDKDLQYTDQLDKTVHSQNIVPWLIKNVIESSGKIVLLKNLKLSRGANIAAKLRY